MKTVASTPPPSGIKSTIVNCPFNFSVNKPTHERVLKCITSSIAVSVTQHMFMRLSEIILLEIFKNVYFDWIIPQFMIPKIIKLV